MVRLVAAVAACVCVCGRGSAPAQDAPPAVVEAWSRPAIQGRPGVLYMTVQGGSSDDVLTHVDADAAARAELHRTSVDGGVTRMRPVDAIDVPARQTVRLEPGGYHVMLLDLRRDLRAGDKIAVVLGFRTAGEVDAVATVRGPGAPPEAMGGMAMPEDRPPGR